MKYGAIFDVDGTLLDSIPAWSHVYVDYLTARSLPPDPAMEKKLNLMSMEQIAAYYQTRYGIADDAATIIRDQVALVERAYRETIPLKPGVKEFLLMLKARGIPMAIATASERHAVTAALRRCGVLSLFPVFLTCTDVGHGKDEPDLFLRCAEEMGTRPENTPVFDDSVHAVCTAHRAGFPVIGVQDDSARDDEPVIRAHSRRFIRSFYELLEGPRPFSFRDICRR